MVWGFNNKITTAMCMYAPEFSTHSAEERVTIRPMTRTLPIRITLMVLGFVFALSATAQCKAVIDSLSGQEVVVYSDAPPQFVGGEAELFRHISKHLKYPSCHTSAPAETIWVQFIVSASGGVGYPRIKKGAAGAYRNAIISMVETMPDWEPGYCEGEPIAFLYTLPITVCFK